MSSILITPATAAIGAVKIAKATLQPMPAGTMVAPPTPPTWPGFAAVISAQLVVASGFITTMLGVVTPSGAVTPPAKVNITACNLALTTIASTSAIVVALTSAAVIALVPATAPAGLATFNATLPSLIPSLTTLENQIDTTLFKPQLA